MKLNDFNTVVTAISADLDKREKAAKKAYDSAQDVSKDEKRALYLAHKEIATKARYVAKLQNEAIAAKAASFVESDAMLRDIISDSYAVEKFTLICSAIVRKAKNAVDSDHSLSQALAYLVANDFKTVEHETMRKNLYKKSDATQCHTTTRQSQMICKLFERLNAAKRIKQNERAATEFDSKHAIVKAINAVYA